MDWTEFITMIPAPAAVTVEAYTGAGAHGRTYAAAATVDGCVIEHKRQRVTTQTQDIPGAVVIASTTVRCPPGTVAPPLSRVTLPDGSVTTVLAAVAWDDHGLGLPSHVELLCE